MKFSFAKSFTLFLVLICVAGYAHAQTTARANCSLAQKEFDELQAVQNNSALDYLSELRSELKIRKSLLSKTVGCAIQRAAALQADLKATPISDERMKNAQIQTVNSIDGAINYYELENSKITDLGLEGSKSFAASLEAWREGNYAPIARRASNIMIWAVNQNLIATAQSRMNQMGHTIGLLSLVGENDLQTIWNETQNSFKNTLALNQGALDTLTGAGDPSQALDLIKSTLDALSDTYQKLFELSNVFTNAPGK